MNAKQNAFCEAITNQDVALVGKLLTADADLVQAPTSWGEIPLNIAAEENNIEVVKLLLEHGADVNAKGNDNYAPLHYAAEHKDALVGELLLSTGASWNVQNNFNNQPLHIAARNNNVRLIHALVSNGADIDARDQSKWTPLFYAVDGESVEAVHVLIAKGADLESRDNNNFTALEHSLVLSLPNGAAILGLLLRGGAILDAYTAIGLRQSHIVSLMLEVNNDLLRCANHGRDFLSLAVSTTQPDLARIMLKFGADPNDCEHLQLPLLEALNIFCGSNAEEMVKLLLEYGADPTFKADPNAKSAYEWATKNRKELVELMN